MRVLKKKKKPWGFLQPVVFLPRPNSIFRQYTGLRNSLHSLKIQPVIFLVMLKKKNTEEQFSGSGKMA